MTDLHITYPWRVEKAIADDLESLIEALPQQSQDFYQTLDELVAEAEQEIISRPEFEERLGRLIEDAVYGLYALGTGYGRGTFSSDDEIAAQWKAREAIERIPNLAEDVYGGRYKPQEEGGRGHTKESRLYSIAALLGGALLLGSLMAGADDDLLRWDYAPEKDHCSQCQELNGQIKTRREWREMAQQGIYPGSWHLECRGIYCGCELVQVQTR